jgi:hypothetical protein
MATRGKSISFFTREAVIFCRSVIFILRTPDYAVRREQREVKSANRSVIAIGYALVYDAPRSRALFCGTGAE